MIRRYRKFFIAFLFAFICVVSAPDYLIAGELDQNGTLWAPYIEWSFNNPTFSGNPFDLIASATFTHTDTGEIRKTEFFYDGNNTWKVRFTATRTGEWSVTTSSSDPDLGGKSGTIIIDPNSDSEIRGFTKSNGNKFVRQSGENGQLEPFLFNVYLNWDDFPSRDLLSGFSNTDKITAYIQDARQYGFDTIFIDVCNAWFELGAVSYDDHSSTDPDPQTFELLEKVITTAHNQGVTVHLWAWGDQERRWTPIGVGGINGIYDKRLQRYIAARLGPLPGWTMGYGFDLQEWVSDSQLKEWAEYLHEHFGWQHLLCARGFTNSELDFVSYSYLNHPYSTALNNINSDPNRPHFFEERDIYTRSGNTMEVTRRHLWEYTMAGGHGGFWGILWGGGPDYPNPEQLLNFDQFWKGRFLMDMSQANEISDGYCLKTNTNSHFVFYKIDTNSIQMDLTNMPSSKQVIAVDTKLAYAELILGTYDAKNHTWSAPYSSDWAVAVGDFGSILPEVDPPAPVNEISQSDWAVWYVDSEEVNGGYSPARYAFDGDSSTIWHTEWYTNEPSPPHELQIDFGQSYEVGGFRYLPRQDGSINGGIGQYEFYVSSDGTNWGSPVVSGQFAADSLEKEVQFDSVTGRYVRLRALTEVNGNPWTSIAEITVLGNLLDAAPAPPANLVIIEN